MDATDRKIERMEQQIYDLNQMLAQTRDAVNSKETIIEIIGDRLKKATELVQIASNLIADDLIDTQDNEEDAPEEFKFLHRAAEFLGQPFPIKTIDTAPIWRE